MKILITGINGLVGNSLHKLLQESDHKLFYSSRNLEGLAKYKVDISKKDEVDSFFKSYGPDAVINTAAMANVDLWGWKKMCWDSNVRGVQNLVECERYVYLITLVLTIFFKEKRTGIYTEDDTPNSELLCKK